MKDKSGKDRLSQSIIPYFNQTKFPRLWLLFQYVLGGTFDKRKIAIKHLSRHKKILEVGCSSGNVSAIFRNFENIKFLGIDIDEKAITFAEKRFRKNEDFKFRCCSLDDLINENEKFDYILFAGILHHISNTETKKMLESSSSLLSENGVIAISEPLPAEKKHNLVVKLYYNLFEQGSTVRTKKEYEKIIENILSLKIIKSSIETTSPFIFNWPICAYFILLVLENKKIY
jgi:2-polyprenyl-3-methyl-5-hydroxy-6-metoxy-1,4-benzoquinol methylase